MRKSFLILDIETIPDPELPVPGTADPERLPGPPHHRVVALGVLWLDRRYGIRRLGVLGETRDEPAILRDFAKLLDKRQPTLVTFNGRGFDLPVIALRCLRHGIPLREYYRRPAVRRRYTADGHLDLMDYLADFGATRASRLDTLAKLCGMPGKVGMDGKDVAPLMQAGRIAAVESYCLGDVVQTAAVFLRVQLLRGVLGRSAYLDRMQELIAVIRDDPRLLPVAAALNEPRLLLSSAPEVAPPSAFTKTTTAEERPA
jgi:predicted PolB exonuclease-like 3'-5' exonuclease